MNHVPERRNFLITAGAAAAGALLWKYKLPVRAAAHTGETQPPNILLIVTDQQRPDWIQDHPYLNAPPIPVPTPNLVQLAQRGTQFKHTLCASPLCAPSRAALASGREYDGCGVPDNTCNYPVDQLTYYTLLRGAGYHVLGVGKFDLDKANCDWGLDGTHPATNLLEQLGFTAGIDNAGKWDGVFAYLEEPVGPKDPYLHYLSQQVPAMDVAHCTDYLAGRHGDARATYANSDACPLTDAQYGDNWIGRNGLSLLNDVPLGEPWHLAVNFNGPHDPTDITATMAGYYRGPNRYIDDFPQPHHYSGPLSPADHLIARQNYAAMIENIDRWLGKFVDAIEARGELENTIIIWTSDHGEMLGDHGYWGKVVPFQPSVCVPLVISTPGGQQGAVSNALVSLIDIPATLLDYAGVPVPAEMDGFSLRSLLEGRTSQHRGYVLSGLDSWLPAFNSWRLCFDGRHKLVLGFWQQPTLFDLKYDPAETTNIAAGQPELVEYLANCIEAGSYVP